MINAQAFELTIEQQFEMRIVEDSLASLTHEEALTLLRQVSKLLFIKDNIIRDLMRRGGL